MIRMKSLIKDESAVSYLLLVGLALTIIISGIAYSFTSDFVDTMMSGINGYAGTPLENQMDSDSVTGGNFLMALFKFFLIPVLFVIVYFAMVMSQKPEKNW
jgi:hypothetical protein